MKENKIMCKVLLIVIAFCALLFTSCGTKKPNEIEEKTFEIVFYSDGVECGRQEFKATEPIYYPDITKEYYLFDGWYFKGTDQLFEFSENLNSYIEVEARWEKNYVEVQFVYDGKTLVTKKLNVEIPYGELPKFEEKTGYTFKWKYESLEITEDTLVLSSNDHIIVGAYIPNKYLITFNDESHYFEKEVEYGSCYGGLVTYTKTGYTFDGWYLGDTKIEPTTIVTITSNQELTLKWIANTYTISFVTNLDGVEVSNMEVTYDTLYGDLPILEKTGYYYKWMYDDKEITPTTLVDITYNITLTAIWNPEVYEVTFDTQGGTSVSASTVTYGETYRGRIAYPEKEGYVFDGWYLGDQKIDETTVVTATSDHTLVAHWSKVE